jgi:hypothetical protein
MIRSPLFLFLAFSLPLAAEETPSFVDAEALIRQVVKSQRLSEERFASYTYDQHETETKYGKDGRPKETTTRLFYVLSGEKGEEGTRELVEVNGRPATEDEKRKAAEEDEKGRKRRLEQRAKARASSPPKVTGDEEDPLVGSRRLSDLIGRFTYRVRQEEVRNGRPAYVVDFEPKKGLVEKTLGERALDSLAGRVVVDAADFQIAEVTARLVKPVKVTGGLAANVKDAVIAYEARPIREERWFPCVVDLRLVGKTLVFFRLDVGYRYTFDNFKSFGVETESEVEREPAGEGP